MRNARWIALSMFGLALFTAAGADDAVEAESDDAHSPLPADVIAGQDFFDDLQQAWRWQVPSAEPVFVYSDRTLAPFDDFEFRDGSSIGRVARLRSVSLLTLAEIGQSRLFFGVSDSEVIGFHFGAITPDDGDRHFEVARMPWLAKTSADDR